MDIQSILVTLKTWLFLHGPAIILILVVTAVLIKIAHMLSDRIFTAYKRKRGDTEFQKRKDTLRSVVRYILTIVIVFVALVMILGEVGIQVGPIIATAGILGVAVGFGAQSLVKDIISGFFILLEDKIRVGDVVQIAGKSGHVERVNLKMTVLRDLAGNVHYVPNGEISVVTNMTKGYSRYVFDIGVAYREDVDEVMDVMKAVDEEMRNDPEFKDDIFEPLEIFGLDKFDDSALVIKARTTTRPIKQWRVAREFNRRLKKAFDERNIEIPFPHTTLYFGKDKDGSSPPMNVMINNDKES